MLLTRLLVYFMVSKITYVLKYVLDSIYIVILSYINYLVFSDGSAVINIFVRVFLYFQYTVYLTVHMVVRLFI
jgi:hypothetical protein